MALRARFSAPEANYNVLNADHPVFGRRGVWDGDYTRELYIRSTDHMIGVLDGTIAEREVVDPACGPVKRPDVVIWLDKSARPCSWFVVAFWDQFATPDATKPRYEFLRIDRRDWLQHMGYSDAEARNAAPKDIRVEAVPDDLVLRLGTLFRSEPIDVNRWAEQVTDAPTTLDGRQVVVVDETHVSGATLAVATGLIARVAPSARVSGTEFWRDRTMKAVGTVRQPGTVPIGYPGETSDGAELTVFGRGVGNSSAENWQRQPDGDEVNRKRLAAAYVSAPLHDPVTFGPLPDLLADQLTQDIAYLTYDLAVGRVLRRPSPSRLRCPQRAPFQ